MATTAESDIRNLRAEIERLRKRRSLLRTVILSDNSTVPRLTRATSTLRNAKSKARVSKALEQADKQQRINTENVYYAGVGVTPFNVHDPDPNAVDDGVVLGLRIDIFDNEEARFPDPYYVFLHRPDPRGHPNYYRIHKHTLPESIGVQDIEFQWLETMHVPNHGIKKLGDDIRAALIVRQNKLNLVKKLARDAEEAHAVETEDEERRVRITNVSSGNRGHTIDIEWEDGSTGTADITDDGLVQDAIVHEPRMASDIPAPVRYNVGRAVRCDLRSATADKMIERLLRIGWA
ncbi:hypothetical protein P152DRAFT_484253 [Eremomyces bilateralis CBS 781.70]|uniref:Cenp-O kinetochore centromere component n=1 Tax=Eremomyces bilateralis CBS 781.70 TaxID=1392243 RepID=A0A6G1FVH8_9PEZI|nr:uncharacterized protein P152DRAFT_484253 [Eremomyces bilateralis CBS 781.70]KAF1809905.1 hypothetical protein P152DRAFT_484253 [Eremomyces bilateralis CBS 781.70]